MDRGVKLTESNSPLLSQGETPMKPISGRILWLGFLIVLVLLLRGRSGGSILEPTMIERSGPQIRGEVTEGQSHERRAFSRRFSTRYKS
jgi:hypothetical protein